MKTSERDAEQIAAVKQALSRMKPSNRMLVEIYLSELADALDDTEAMNKRLSDMSAGDKAALRAHQYRIDYLMRRSALFEALFSGVSNRLLMRDTNKESNDAYLESCWKQIEKFYKSEWSLNNP